MYDITSTNIPNFWQVLVNVSACMYDITRTNLEFQKTRVRYKTYVHHLRPMEWLIWNPRSKTFASCLYFWNNTIIVFHQNVPEAAGTQNSKHHFLWIKSFCKLGVFAVRRMNSSFFPSTRSANKTASICKTKTFGVFSYYCTTHFRCLSSSP